MTLLVRKKLGWLLWLTPFLFSCESEEILSLPQEPGDQTLSLLFKEIPLSYSVVQLDSVATSRRRNDNSHRFLTGVYRSEFFGELRATAFTELGIGSRSEVTADDEYDSLVLTLVNDYFYGDANQAGSQTVSIYPLLDTLARTAYYRTDEIPFEATPLGQLNFVPDVPDPDVASSADTLRVVLDNTFGQELLDLIKAGDDALQSDSTFREYFPGLALSSTTPGFVTGFNPAGLRMTLYFSTSAETESSTYTFAVDGGQPTFNNITVDRSGTPLAGLTTENEEISAADNGFYLQAATGLVSTLKLDPVLDFLDSLEENTDAQLRVNRVELYIGTTPLTNGQPLPARIVAFNFEEDFSLIFDTIPQGFSQIAVPRGLRIDGVPPQDGVFPISPLESTYQIPVTQYLQNLIDEFPGTDSEFLVRGFRLGNQIDEVVAEQDSVFAKVFYTSLE